MGYGTGTKSALNLMQGNGDFVCLTPVSDRASEQIFEVTKLLSDE